MNPSDSVESHRPRLFSIGHSTQSLPDFITLLQQ